MIFTETKLKGAYIIDIEKLEDERGFFARSFCQKEFESHGLNPRLVQCNISFNLKKGTLRGIHYQVAPHEEAKLVRCVRGSIYDVIIDIRPDSETYCQWIGVELGIFSLQLTAHSSQSVSSSCHLPSPIFSPSSNRSELTAHCLPGLANSSQLTAQYRMLYIPEGFAHGYLTLEDDTEIFYQMSQFYAPESARGVRWNDPAFNIQWPIEVQVISERDKTYPDFRP